MRADSGNRDRPCSPTPPLPTRLLTGAITGLAILGFGLALGAAGVLPRLAVNPETNLAGGDYARLGEAGVLNPPWHLDYLLLQTLGAGSGYHVQAASFGGAAVVLSLLAIPLAGRRYAVPFFLALTLAAMILTLQTTPLHLLFYLIPRYREFHDHDAWRSIALTAIGPAMMSGAALDALPRWRGRWRLLPIVVAPLLLLTILTVRVWHPATFVGWLPLIAAAIATALVAVVVVTPADRRRPTTIGQVANLMPAAILAVAFLVPTGLQLSGSWLGWPHSEIWDERWRSDPAAEAALTADSQWSDPGGAGEFLQRELAASGPFRYAGYGGFGYASDADLGESYMGRRFDPNITALLVNGRPIHLGLYDVQGYNPLQLSRYVEFMTTLNGAEQDYHTAFLLASGAQSPLLDLLDVRYLLVDAALPPARDDVRALTAGAQEVFRTPQVIVYERSPTPRHAWIVHDVRQVSRGEALPLLGARVIDPYRLALVEETPPATGQPAAGAEESARVVQQSPDSLTIATRAAAPGLLVVSEIYEAGWRAFVDGSPAPLLPTDHALQGIPLPAGAHTVELRYAPIALRVGLGISGIAALALLAILVTAGWSFVARRHRPSGDSPPAAGTRTRPHPS